MHINSNNTTENETEMDQNAGSETTQHTLKGSSGGYQST